MVFIALYLFFIKWNVKICLKIFVLLFSVGINCWNPAFDVTPADLITGGIITEIGVFAPESIKDNLEKLSHFDLLM